MYILPKQMDDGHDSRNCLKSYEMSYSKKREIIRRTGACLVCCRVGHLARSCRKSIVCGICRGRHIEPLCRSGGGKGDRPRPTDNLENQAKLKARPHESSISSCLSLVCFAKEKYSKITRQVETDSKVKRDKKSCRFGRRIVDEVKVKRNDLKGNVADCDKMGGLQSKNRNRKQNYIEMTREDEMIRKGRKMTGKLGRGFVRKKDTGCLAS